MTNKGAYSQLRELMVLIAQQCFQLQLAGQREVHDSSNWLTVMGRNRRGRVLVLTPRSMM